jgi:type VI protein secretion system component Hcp
MESLRPIVLAGVIAASAVQSAVAATFLFIPGVLGESKDARHPAWIDVQSMSVGVANRVCSGLTLSKFLDTSSPVLSAAALAGTAYPSMTLEVTSAGERPETFLTYALTNVTVSSVSVSNASGLVVESLTLQPAMLTMTYRPMTDGGLGTAITMPLTCKK